MSKNVDFCGAVASVRVVVWLVGTTVCGIGELTWRNKSVNANEVSTVIRNCWLANSIVCSRAR